MKSKITMRQPAQEEIAFKRETRQRLDMEHRSRKLLILLIALAVVYIVCMLFAEPLVSQVEQYLSLQSLLHAGAHNSFRLSTYVTKFQQNIADLFQILAGGDVEAMIAARDNFHNPTDTIYNLFSLPVVMAAGAGLAVVGSVYQGSFRNTVASPSVLGIMSGGTLGGTIWIMFGSEEWAYETKFQGIGGWFPALKHTKLFYRTEFIQSGLDHFLFVMAGSFLAIVFVALVARMAGRGKMNMVTLIVTGLVFTSVVDTFNTLLCSTPMSDFTGEALREHMLAVVKCTSAGQMLIIVIPILVIIILFMLMAKRLNLLVFGEEEARAMGVNVRRERMLLLIISTALTAFIIAAIGQIGFVGLIIPNIVRKMIGSDFRVLIPGSAMAGAIFVMVLYMVPNLSTTWQRSASSYTSLVGGAVFIILVIRNRRKRNADWA